MNNSRTQFVETCLALNIHPGEQVWDLWQAAERYATEKAMNDQVQAQCVELVNQARAWGTPSKEHCQEILDEIRTMMGYSGDTSEKSE